MRIGVFGGTFDPVHAGHLILAEQCRAQGRLDRVLFIPAPRPPHKQDRQLTPFAQRVEMLALAIAGQPAFQISELERDRPGPSYTVDTLAELQRDHPGAELWLLIGADTLHDLPLWHEPVGIVRQAGLLVVDRRDSKMLTAAELEKALRLPPDVKVRLQPVPMPLIEIASRDIRRRIAEGQSIRYLVPRAVEAYIQDKRLYLTNTDGS
jgi:nicotinate-nucleotide adenylyltransferase